MKNLKNLILAVVVISTLLFSNFAHANDGSWFGVNAGYENLSSGFNSTGTSIGAEGGYWYLGNMAYGGSFKANFFGTANSVSGSNLTIYDLGGFWKAGDDNGLYGKLLAGVEFINVSGTVPAFKVGSGKSFYFGLGGGFLFRVTDAFRIGPEVTYRHLMANGGGDQVSMLVLGTFSF